MTSGPTSDSYTCVFYSIVCIIITDARLLMHCKIPKSVTLNDLERCNDRRPALSLWSVSFLSALITIVYCLFWFFS